MNQKKKISRKVISYVLALVMVLSTMMGIVPGMSLTAYAADTTVTWSAADIKTATSNTFTKDGVTLAAGYIDSKPMLKGGGTFTTTLGNFTKIEISADSVYYLSGTGWSKNGYQSATWTGNAASVSYSGEIWGGGMHHDGDYVTIKFTISDKQTQTITADNVTATYGDTGKKIEATTSGDGALSYTVKSGDAVTVDGSGNLTINKAGSAVITVTAAENDTYAKATKDVNVTVNTKAMTVSAEDVNATVDGQPHGITVNVTDPASGYTVKYGTEVGTYNLDASPTQTEAGELTVYYQVTADNYTTYTGSAKVTVNAKQTQTITAADVTANYGDTDKKVSATTNGNGAISYEVKDGSADYIDVDTSTGALTIKKVGTATVIVTAAETSTYAQATKEVTVTINKANAVAATVTANNRTYDGTDKPLVNVTGEATGGEMQYALGDANGATEPYTTSIPTKTDAGTYYVWYKVVGDANHNSTEPNSVEAKINPVDKTDLNTAIEEAEAYYESIKEDDVYAQVAEALKNAIDEAKKYTNDNVAEKEVKEAIETIKAAKDDAEEGKKEADDTVVANEVADAINALPASDKVATTDKAAIEAARKAYDALTADQKKKVSADTLKKLTDSETALTVAEKKAAEEEAAKKKEEADTKAANAVVETINKLPVSNKVATTDKAAIEAARKAYDALTADQKKKVSADTLKKLTDAETALKAAEKKAAEDKAAAEKKAAEEKAARELAAAKQEAQAAMNEQVTVTQKGNKFTVKWKKSSAADGYYVYAQYCGKKITKPAKTIAKNTTTKTTITKINGKKINQKRQFRVYVVPYKIIDGKKVALGKSTVAHLVGAKSTKYSNVKKLTLTKKKYTVKVGKTAKIKAKVTLVNKNKKHIPKGHGAKFRYKSSDTSIATVDKNGKIKGIKKGTCTIYVYSINGLMKKAKVTIK